MEYSDIVEAIQSADNVHDAFKLIPEKLEQRFWGQCQTTELCYQLQDELQKLTNHATEYFGARIHLEDGLTIADAEDLIIITDRGRSTIEHHPGIGAENRRKQQERRKALLGGVFDV